MHANAMGCDVQQQQDGMEVKGGGRCESHNFARCMHFVTFVEQPDDIALFSNQLFAIVTPRAFTLAFFF